MPQRLLELFSGTGSMGRAFEELGWEVTSLDVDPKASPTICADICSWESLPKFAPGYFDMIWASPVCTEYSRVLTRRPRRLEEGDRLVLRFWAIENPATGLLKLRPFMAGLPWRDVSYCTYGYPYRKLTRVWGNLDWMPEQPVRGVGGYRCERSRPPQWQDSAELPQPSTAVQHPASPVSGDCRHGQR